VGRKKTSTKKVKKRMEGYQKVIAAHQEKIAKERSSLAAPHWEKEIKAAQDKLENLGERLKKRKKRGK